MNIFEKANRANDRAALIEYRMGDPHRRQLLIRRETPATNFAPIITDFLISPPPKVTTPSTRLIGLTIGNEQSSITISANDFLVTVSRSIQREIFVRSDTARVMAWLDPPLNSAGAVVYADQLKTLASGIECRIIHVDDRDCCDWKLLLRRVADR
jgi:hypothetical protein